MFWSKSKNTERKYSKADVDAVSTFFFELLIRNQFSDSNDEKANFICHRLPGFKPREVSEFVSHYFQDLDRRYDQRTISEIINNDLIDDFKKNMNSYWKKTYGQDANI